MLQLGSDKNIWEIFDVYRAPTMDGELKKPFPGVLLNDPDRPLWALRTLGSRPAHPEHGRVEIRSCSPPTLQASLCTPHHRAGHGEELRQPDLGGQSWRGTLGSYQPCEPSSGKRGEPGQVTLGPPSWTTAAQGSGFPARRERRSAAPPYARTLRVSAPSQRPHVSSEDGSKCEISDHQLGALGILMVPL